MNGKLIFKMELFKFSKDKIFLMSIGMLSTLNIAFTSMGLGILGGKSNLGNSSGLIIFFFCCLMLIITNCIVSFMYPFHMISMDYKNNVMAMMVASGVNRKKLFFAKMGAALCYMLLLLLALRLIPLLLVFLHSPSTEIWKQDKWQLFFSILFFNFNFLHIKSTIDFNNLTYGLPFFSWIIDSIEMIVLVALSCIISKGRKFSVFIFIALSSVSHIINFIALRATIHTFGTLGILSDLNKPTSMLIIEQIATAFSIGIFGYIAMKTLARQNL